MLQVKVHKDVSAKEKTTFPAFSYVNIRRFKLFSVKKHNAELKLNRALYQPNWHHTGMEV